jgi:23S rRNA (adenine2503-C2)-methyltransferase
MKLNLIGYDRDKLKRWFADRGEPAYRADQVLRWAYHYRAASWDKMVNLSAATRNALAEAFYLRAGEVVDSRRSRDGTIKSLIHWRDGAMAEAVLMIVPRRRTVCISTQVGCPVMCRFCASGLEGLQRSLDAGEIVEQVLWAADQLEPGQRISNVVVMGMGEPLANYDNTLAAVKILNAPWGLGIAARHITVSTIGLPEQIRRLAKEPIQLTLAVSLHAAENRLRADLIPWTKKIPLVKLFDAVDDYYQMTHREVTLEYLLLKNVNSSFSDADKLADLAGRSRCNVNLIVYNPVPEFDFQPAPPKTVQAFIHRLKQHGVNAHLRKSLGGQIDAACGQLRRRFTNP